MKKLLFALSTTISVAAGAHTVSIETIGGALDRALDQASDFGVVKNTVSRREISASQVYRIGNRDQRIRMFISSENTQLLNGPAFQKLATDPMGSSQINSFFFSSSSSTRASLAFGENNTSASILAQPSALICYTDLLKLVKRVGDSSNVMPIFDKFRIDEVNLFLKPVLSHEMISPSQVQMAERELTEATARLKTQRDEYQVLEARNRELTAWLRANPNAPAEQSGPYRAEITSNEAKMTDLNRGAAESKTAIEKNTHTIKNAYIPERDLKLEISPVAQVRNDPALNIQIPFFVDQSSCYSPTEKELEKAIFQAAGMPLPQVKK